MIAQIAGLVTRREGRKFNRLNVIDESIINAATLVKGEGLSLYVHIPFCRSLCPFCCFNRYLFDEGLAHRYFKDLKQELEMYRARGFSFSDVYFGGGTPTVLMDELGGFIGHLRQQFKIHQISLETTPRELTPQNIRLLKDYGIHRLSIGVLEVIGGRYRLDHIGLFANVAAHHPFADCATLAVANVQSVTNRFVVGFAACLQLAPSRPRF